MAKWYPISTLERAGRDGDVIFWNPCDGCHMLWMAYHGPAERVRAKFPEFTHWMRGPQGPKTSGQKDSSVTDDRIQERSSIVKQT